MWKNNPYCLFLCVVYVAGEQVIVEAHNA